jgi:hypothetical protein
VHRVCVVIHGLREAKSIMGGIALMIDQIFQLLGQVVLYGGFLVGIAYWLFRKLAEKWLENKFAERLQDYKHAQNKEIEEVRFRINSIFDRLTKLHQREFEVLPEAWARLCEAYRAAGNLLVVIKTRPDLNRMNEELLTETLNATELKESEKEEVLRAPNKNKCYSDHIVWHELIEAEQASINCHYYLLANGIFLKQEMKDSFNQVDDFIWKAIRKRKEWLEDPQAHRECKSTTFIQEAEPLMKDLETKVRGRVHE